MSIVVKLIELALMNRSDSKLPLHGGDERWSLEESASKSFQSASELSLSSRQLIMKAYDTNIFFASTLLRFDEAGCPIAAND
jgi:hypothetical protein